MLTDWDQSGARVPFIVGSTKLGALALDHRGARAVGRVTAWLARAQEARLLPYLRWWLREYKRHSEILAGSATGFGLLLDFLETDPEFWRSVLIGLLPTTAGQDRERLLTALVRHANKATIDALASVPGSDVASARKGLVRRHARQIHIRAFGALAIQRGGPNSAVTTVDKRRLRAVLGLLVVHSGKVSSRDHALDVLWPEAEPAAAVNSLNQAIYQLRRVIDPEHRDGESVQYIISTPDALQLDAELVRTDLDEFRALATRVHTIASVTDRRQVMRSMIDLIRGNFLEDLRYEDWMPEIETAIHAEVRDALLPIALGEGDAADLSIRAASALTLLDEFDEEAVLALAHQLARTGRRPAARSVLLRFATKVETELADERSAELESAIRATTGGGTAQLDLAQR